MIGFDNGGLSGLVSFFSVFLPGFPLSVIGVTFAPDPGADDCLSDLVSRSFFTLMNLLAVKDLKLH